MGSNWHGYAPWRRWPDETAGEAPRSEIATVPRVGASRPTKLAWALAAAFAALGIGVAVALAL